MNPFRAIYPIDDMPSVQSEPEPKRLIRLIVSPETTECESLTITHVIVPPSGVSSGHIHGNSDEYILFLNDGKVLLDQKEFQIKRNTVVIAKKGVWHECINTSDTGDLILYCVFSPALEPFGIFNELIRETRQYFDEIL